MYYKNIIYIVGKVSVNDLHLPNFYMTNIYVITFTYQHWHMYLLMLVGSRI
jgi:hypothetical protein